MTSLSHQGTRIQQSSIEGAISKYGLTLELALIINLKCSMNSNSVQKASKATI